MAKSCTVCKHKDAESITLELLRGEPVRSVGTKYGFSSSAIQRHKGHIPQQLPAEVADTDIVEVKTALASLRELERRADLIYRQATIDADPKLALQCLKELRGISTVYARITGELSKHATVTHQHLHLHQAPEWISMRAQILAALEPFPAAREALIRAIGGGVDVRE